MTTSHERPLPEAELHERSDEPLPVLDGWTNYVYVYLLPDGQEFGFEFPARTDDEARGNASTMFMSWHACGSFIGFGPFQQSTFAPDALRLECVAPDDERVVASYQLIREPGQLGRE